MVTAAVQAQESSCPVEPPRDERFLLRAVDWQAYRKISEALSGHHVRLTYDRGNLEFMTISYAHGNLGRLLGRLIVVLTEELALPIRSCGDMTCDRCAQRWKLWGWGAVECSLSDYARLRRNLALAPDIDGGRLAISNRPPRGAGRRSLTASSYR